MATARRLAVPLSDISAATPARARIRGLDGARGLAAVGVLIAHVADYYPAESALSARITALVGVSLIFFFVLSGFLLFLPYVRALTESESPKMPSTKYYAAQRFARVFPAYIFILLITNYVLQTAYLENPMLYPFGSGGGAGMITDSGQLLANLTLVQTYIPQYFQTGLNPSWSLSMEFAFYGTLPVLCLVIFAARKRFSVGPYKLAVIAVVALLVMGFVGKLLAPVLIPDYDTMNPWLTNWGPNWGAVYLRSFPVNADNYALGMFAAIVVVALERRVLAERLSRRVRLYSALAIIPAGVLFVVSLALRRQFETTALALFGALLILVIVAPAARGQDSMLANWFDIGPFRFLGRVSLSLCLWHFPIMLLLGRWGLMRIGSVSATLENIVLVFVIALVVSTVSFYCVERPAMIAARRLRKRWR
ncbi:MAG TPA: acyltransferase [Mycobacterium sp.]|nr:acyltransferase [Mycobacterium sp.]